MSTELEAEMVPILLRKWRILLLLCTLGFSLGVIYSFVASKWYSATLTVVQSQQSHQSAASSIAAKLPIAVDSVATDVHRISAVLSSASVADQVIDKFKLQERYGESARERTRAELWGHCTTSVDRKSGLVSLTCEDRDPKMAMEMAAYFGEIGNKVFQRVSASSAKEERLFLEAQVDKARRDVEDSSNDLRAFQEKHKIIDLPEQSKAVISAMASLEGDLLSKDLELSYLRSFSAQSEAKVVQLQQQTNIIRAKLAQLEASRTVTQPALGSAAQPATGSGAAAGSNEFFPGAMSVPELRLQLEQLLREQKIRETVFALMIQRFEMAKVDEARDTSTFQILDYPTLPTVHTRPKRRRVASLGALGGIAVGIAWIVLPVWWRRRVVPLKQPPA